MAARKKKTSTSEHVPEHRAKNQPKAMERASRAGVLPEKDHRSKLYSKGARHTDECGEVGKVGNPGNLGSNAR